MIVFPIAAAVVAAAFAFATYRAAKPTDVALRVWSVALAQFAIACGAVVWGVGFGWTPMVYRAFYLFGAVLNVAWLALGTAWLFVPRGVALVLNIVFIVAATAASGLVLSARLAPGAQRALAGQQLPAPHEVMSDVPRALSRIFSTGGSVAVLAGLVWGTVRRRHVLGLGLLAVGVVIAALASVLARRGDLASFCVGLAIGICVMYAGFLKTGSS